MCFISLIWRWLLEVETGPRTSLIVDLTQSMSVRLSPMHAVIVLGRCAVWLGPQPGTCGNAIPTVPMEVTNISTSIRLYCSEMLHCMLENCVRHRTANYCRRLRFSWFIVSNIDCLIFSDLLASVFLCYIYCVHNVRWLEKSPTLLLSLHQRIWLKSR